MHPLPVLTTAVFAVIAVFSSPSWSVAERPGCPALVQALEARLAHVTSTRVPSGLDPALDRELDDMAARVLALPEGPEREAVLRYYMVIECPGLATDDADI